MKKMKNIDISMKHFIDFNFVSLVMKTIRQIIF